MRVCSCTGYAAMRLYCHAAVLAMRLAWCKHPASSSALTNERPCGFATSKPDATERHPAATAKPEPAKKANHVCPAESASCGCGSKLSKALPRKEFNGTRRQAVPRFLSKAAACSKCACPVPGASQAAARLAWGEPEKQGPFPDCSPQRGTPLIPGLRGHSADGPGGRKAGMAWF
jgi:hypothetical protein